MAVETAATTIPPVDPAQEFASAGWFPMLGTLFGGGINRMMPWSFDDLMQAFGDELYERIMWDAQVAANLHVLKAGILGQEPRLSAAVPEEDPRHQYAQEIAEFFERVLGRLSGLRTHTLYNMLDCFMVGNKIAERVYERAPEEGGKYILKRLAVKPRRALQFIVSPFLETIGFRISVPAALAETLDVRRDLPPSKCSVLAYSIRDEDPRGSSLGRAIYEPWMGKLQASIEYLKYLAQFSSASILAVLGEKATQLVQVYGTDGLPVTENGAPKTIRPADAVLQVLQAIRSGGVGVLPFGTNPIVIPPQGNGEPFLSGFQYYNAEITIGMLGQRLATQEGEHQSRASSQVHQDVLATRIQLGKTMVEEMLWLLFDDLRQRNFPNSEGLTPRVSMGDVGPEDMASVWMAVAALSKSAYLTPSQKRILDAQVGLPVREQEEVEAEQERAAAPPAPDPNAPSEPDDDGEADDAMTAAFWRWQGWRPVRGVWRAAA